MKIALINPPFDSEDSVGSSKSIEMVLNITPPLGIAYIASYLKENGHHTKIYDCTAGVSKEELIKDILEFVPDVIGITATTPSFSSANNTAKSIKEVLPNIITVVGGAHATAMPEHALKSNFDLAILGEGEISFSNLISHLKNYGTANLDNIKGLAFLKDGKLVINEKEKFIKDLDTLPLPARELLPPLKSYHPTPASYIKLPLAVIVTSRGCPFQCTFCDRAVFGQSSRFNSAEYVIREMEEMINIYGAKEIRFFDDTFTLNRDRVIEICNMIIDKRLKIPWSCLTRTDSVDEELLRIMKKAGCWQILYGIESSDDEVLALIKKGKTNKENIEAINIAKKVGLSIRCDFIVGVPGQTLKQMWNSVEFAKKMGVDYAHFNKFIPYPGTEIYSALVDQGYSFDFDQKSSILDHSALMYVPEGVTKEEMTNFLDKSNRSFYLRPSYMIRRLLTLRSFTEFIGQIKGLFAIRGL